MIDQQFPLTEYYVAFNIKCLTLGGLWNPYKDNRKWLYYVYSRFLPIFVMLTRIDGFVKQFWAVQNDFLQVTLILFLALGLICGFIKNVNILLHHSDIEFIAASLNWERSVICSTEIALYRNKIITKTMKITRHFTLLWLLLSACDVMFFYRDIFDENRRTIDDLLIRFTLLRNLLEPLNFSTVLVIDYLTFAICCSTVVIYDSLFLSLMLHIATQLKLLNFRLQRCTVTDTDCSSSFKLKNKNFIDFECPRRNWNVKDIDSNQELIICIRHYQVIVRMMRILKKVYGMILLPQLLSSVILISFVGIHLFVTKTIDLGNPSSAAVVILGLCSVLAQLTAYCWGGDNIIMESNRICVSAYSSDWYQEDMKFRTNLKMFSAMTMKPLCLSALGFFELSFVTLKDVLLKSYSAMALLQKANE